MREDQSYQVEKKSRISVVLFSQESVISDVDCDDPYYLKERTTKTVETQHKTLSRPCGP